jgi:hypothetical protein
MTTMEKRSAPLWTRGMIAVLSAQFLSAMADNASTPWSPGGVWCCAGNCDWDFVVAAAVGACGAQCFVMGRGQADPSFRAAEF